MGMRRVQLLAVGAIPNRQRAVGMHRRNHSVIRGESDIIDIGRALDFLFDLSGAGFPNPQGR
jgi:hypothetical protein